MTGSARGSPVSPLPDSDDIFMATGDEIETSILMEADTVRIEQHQNGQSIPVGPSTAVDLIVASAARAAADAALADSSRKVPAESANGDTNVDGDNTKAEATPPTNLFPSDARESRRKRVAAKSVISGTPSNSVRSIPRQSTVLYEFEAYEAKKNDAISPSKKGGSKATTRTSPSKAKTKSPPKKSTSKTKVVPKKATKQAAKHTTATTTSTGFAAAKEIWSGVPTEQFEYSWKGWTKKTFERQSGKTKGTKDSYWYTPKNQYKLRSLVEVRRFCDLLKKYKSEEVTWIAFKGK